MKTLKSEERLPNLGEKSLSRVQVNARKVASNCPNLLYARMKKDE